MKKIILAGLVLVLAGCATEGRLRGHLDSLVGHDVSQVIERMGPPSSTFDLPNGKKMYTWNRAAGAVAGPMYGLRGPAYAAMVYCNISITANPIGLVDSYQYEGNNCVSK